MLLRIASLFFILFASAAQAGTVVASIKPLHSLVAGVMEGDGNRLVLLADGGASLHHYALKPSQRTALAQADLVFYIGDSMEFFLEKPLKALPETAKAAMVAVPDLTLYPVRSGSGFEEEEEDEHHHGAMDMHLWLAPENAVRMTQEIARALSARYPQHAALYMRNAKTLEDRIHALDTQIAAELKPYQGQPFVVFHDATQYFEKRYGLKAIGSITLHPGQEPGAKHLAGIRRKIVESGARCVFREPEFDGRVVESMIDGTQAASGVLDPEGALIPAGPELYATLMKGLADAMQACFAAPQQNPS